MDKSIVICFAIAALTLMNIVAFRYMGILAFFVTAASIPFAQELLKMIGHLP
jgi:hypothetical protein